MSKPVDKPYAKIILDSINERGERLTTMEVCCHRFVLSEFNTHRAFCLAGDNMIELEHITNPVSMTMSVEDYVDMWSKDINLAKQYKINQMIETETCISTSFVITVYKSGVRPVYTLRTSNYEVHVSSDHLIYTPVGYLALRELRINDEIYTKTGIDRIVSITYRGEEDTFDLEIAGKYPNFIANGVVVHNSRNSASSRAVPVSKNIEKIKKEPAIPLEWGKRCAGMSAKYEVDFDTKKQAMKIYEDMLQSTLDGVSKLNELGIHKQVANRFLEPFSWHTIVVTATDWENFFAQRAHPDAQPEICVLAERMIEAYDNSTPTKLSDDDFHTPYILPEEYNTMDLVTRKKVSIARCARVSYLTHDGVRDTDKDIDLYNKLVCADPPHYSPFEHIACPGEQNIRYDNFKGWKSSRWLLK